MNNRTDVLVDRDHIDHLVVLEEQEYQRQLNEAAHDEAMRNDPYADNINKLIGVRYD